MRANQYTKEQLAFLEAGYLTMRIPELTAAFNERFGLDKNRTAIRSALKNHRYTCGRPTGGTKGDYRIFSREQAAFIGENYKSLSQGELAAAVNEAFGTSFTAGQIRSFTRNHRIRSGRTGRFEQGNRPWNTDTKGLTHANRTSFKPGSVPPNRKPVGFERICTKDGYILVKIEETNPYTGGPTRYKAKHIVVWEKAHGPVPKDMAVIFLDSDKTHCALDNLALVNRSELLRLNRLGYTETPGELKPSVFALARLETKMKNREKGLGDDLPWQK